MNALKAAVHSYTLLLWYRESPSLGARNVAQMSESLPRPKTPS